MLGRKLNLCSYTAGHVHAYERSVRVFNNRPHECGPVHIVIGDGGNREVCCFLTCRNMQNDVQSMTSCIGSRSDSRKKRWLFNCCTLKAVVSLVVAASPTDHDVAAHLTGLGTRLPGSAQVVGDAGGQLRPCDPGL